MDGERVGGEYEKRNNTLRFPWWSCDGRGRTRSRSVDCGVSRRRVTNWSTSRNHWRFSKPVLSANSPKRRQRERINCMFVVASPTPLRIHDDVVERYARHASAPRRPASTGTSSTPTSVPTPSSNHRVSNGGREIGVREDRPAADRLAAFTADQRRTGSFRASDRVRVGPRAPGKPVQKLAVPDCPEPPPSVAATRRCGSGTGGTPRCAARD